MTRQPARPRSNPAARIAKQIITCCALALTVGGCAALHAHAPDARSQSFFTSMVLIRRDPGDAQRSAPEDGLPLARLQSDRCSSPAAARAGQSC